MLKADEILDDLQNGYFIIQKKKGFKFGVDAVLLSDFAKDARSKRTLDLCTGTGIVPVLLAAKTDTPRIDALEIQEDMADTARRGVEYNKLGDRISVTCGDLKDAVTIYGGASFDTVTCNPPYMKRGAGLLGEADAKTIARHEILCTLDDVVRVSSKLLISKGRFFMIHRPSRLTDILCCMRGYKLEPKRLRLVCPSEGKPPNLVLVEGMKDGGGELKVLPTLVVHNADGSYTDEIDIIYGRTK